MDSEQVSFARAVALFRRLNELSERESRMVAASRQRLEASEVRLNEADRQLASSSRYRNN